MFIIIGSLLFFITGCNEKQKLTGKVTFPDGKPLQYGTIYFASETYPAHAVLQNDGTYDVGSLGKKDGLPPGKYKVYIVGAIMDDEPIPVTVSAAPAVGDDNTQTPPVSYIYSMKSLIDTRFTKPETTPLEITIPDLKTFDFFVEPPMKK
ncbi:MAG: hypothetical protein LBE12_00875 [Planctomycetaceae bacterium]|nr:hypothetical protein [Planctomycetaceae bacterium]